MKKEICGVMQTCGDGEFKELFKSGLLAHHIETIVARDRRDRRFNCMRDKDFQVLRNVS
jgi:hypothetical protein